jgi:hypothetical protein
MIYICLIRNKYMTNFLHKQLFMLYLLVSCLQIDAHAQVDSLALKSRRILAGLNLTQSPTDYIAEYGSPYGQLRCYNGIKSDSSNLTRNHYLASYYTLQTARIRGTDTLTNLGAFDLQLQAANHDSSIALGLVTGRLSHLRRDAVTENLLRLQNGTLFDVVGRTQSPFRTDNIILLCPSVESLQTGRKYRLFFNPANIKAFQGMIINQIKLDVHSGLGMQVLEGKQYISLSLNDTSLKYVRLTVQAVTNFGTLEVDAYLSTTKPQPEVPLTYNQTPDFVHIIPAVSGRHAGGLLKIKYAASNVNSSQTTGEKQFNKPLLMVSGFDISSVAPLMVNNNLQRLLLGRPIQPIEQYDFNLDILKQQVLDNQLDNEANRDLVVLQMNDGTDDITRNAELFVSAMEYINSMRSSTPTPTVVLGVSMGGLVARYALAGLDRGGFYPNSALNRNNLYVSDLITLDSPHRGANVPTGLQFILRGLQNTPIFQSSLFVRYGDDILNSPAARQMLLKRSTGNNDQIENTTFLADNGAYRARVDYPNSSFQFHAISDGSECGQNAAQQFQKIASIFFSGGYMPTPVSAILLGNRVFFPRLTTLDADAWLGKENSSAGTRTCRYREYGLFLVDIIGIFNILSPDYQRDYFEYSPVSYDHVAGGTYDPSFNVSPGYGSLFLGLATVFSPITGITGYFTGGINNSFTFVPLASAIDQPLGTQQQANQVQNFALPFPSFGRLTSYVTQQPVRYTNGSILANQSHTDLSPRSGDLILAIAKNTPPPGFNNYCSPSCESTIEIRSDNSIEYSGGYKMLCQNQPTFFKANVDPNAGSIQWLTTNATLLTGQGTPSASFVITDINGPEPILEVIYRLNVTGCSRRGRRTLLKPQGPTLQHLQETRVASTTPGTPAYYDQLYSHAHVELIDIRGNRHPYLGINTGVNWTSPYVPTAGNPLGTMTIFQPLRSQICVRATNHCYVNPRLNYLVANTYVEDCRSVQGMSVADWDNSHVVINPNPGVWQQDNTLAVQILEDENNVLPQPPFNISINDERGETINKFEVTAPNFDLPVAGLLPSTYHLYAVDVTGAEWKADFAIVDHAGGKLTLSPNPARMGIDYNVMCRVLDGSETANYSITVTNFSGTVVRTMTATNPAFKILLDGLSSGTYNVHVTDGTRQWSEDLDFLYAGTPWLTLSPNPANNIVTITVNEPLYPDFTAYYTVIDWQGNTVLQGKAQGPQFVIEGLASLPIGQYGIIVNDGHASYNKHLQISR